MKTESRVILSALLFALIGFVLYRVSFIVTPFVVALILSYFLHPAICYFEKKGVARILAVVVVMVVFFATFISLILWIIPILYEQMSLLIKTIPFYFKIYQVSFYPKIVDLASSYSIPLDVVAKDVFDPKEVTDFAKKISLGLFGSSVSIVNFFSLIFVVPILIFYFLKDWKLLKENFFGGIPSAINEKARQILEGVDKNLSGYMRGQAIVCLIMAGVYSLLFLIAGLDFGLLIGILTGIFSFIPYVGAFMGFAAAVIIALFQWGFSVTDVSLVIGAFFIGQILESNFLTPRLIGERVGLHPVWIIFAIFAFGALFGFIGVLLAMPLAAVSAVLIKELVFEYKKRYIKK